MSAVDFNVKREYAYTDQSDAAVNAASLFDTLLDWNFYICTSIIINFKGLGRILFNIISLC